MKKIKITIFLIIILFLSGCSVEYNLVINEDGTIAEKVVAQEKTKRMESLTNLKDKQAVTYLYNMFKRDGEDFNFNYNNDSMYTYGTVTTYHDDIETYSNKFVSDVIKKVNITSSSDLVTINANQDIELGSEYGESLIYDDITVNIEIPYIVTENNADSVKGDVYTWHIQKSKDLKNIKISYKALSKKDKVNVKVNNKTYNINYSIIIISGTLIVVGLIVLFIYIKNKKNNIV